MSNIIFLDGTTSTAKTSLTTKIKELSNLPFGNLENEREIKFSDRPIGLAVLKFTKVHTHNIDDIEIKSE